RLLPDSSPVNNSGTSTGVKRLMDIFEKNHYDEVNLGTVTAKGKEYLKAKTSNKFRMYKLNQEMAPQKNVYNKVNAVKKMTDQTDDAITKGISAIVGGREQFDSTKEGQ